MSSKAAERSKFDFNRRRLMATFFALLSLGSQLALPPAVQANSATKTYSFPSTFTINAIKSNQYRVRVVLATGVGCRIAWLFDECEVITKLTMTNTKWSSSNTSRLPQPSQSSPYRSSSCVQKRNRVFNALYGAEGNCGSSTTMFAYSRVWGTYYNPPSLAGIAVFEQIQWATYVSTTSTAASAGSVTMTVPVAVSFYQKCYLPPLTNVTSGAALRVFIETRSSSSGSWTVLRSGNSQKIGQTAIASDCVWAFGVSPFQLFLAP
jgi:hypothetical protein